MGLMSWLDKNTGAVTAIAMMLQVGVTVVYAIFTLLLWWATKRQADITQSMFEASHRPFVNVEPKEPTETNVVGGLSFRLVVTNQGTVPADITNWEVRGTLMDIDGVEQPVPQREPVQNPIGRSLGPHDSGEIEVHFVGEGLPNPILPFRLRGSVQYRGVGPWTFETEFDAERVGEAWRGRGWRRRK